MPPVRPLYTIQDAERALPRLVGRAHENWFDLVNRGARVMLLDAGHILGSAITILELNESGRTIRLGFSGDLGRPGTLLLRDPEIVRSLDYLSIESTYGDREHGALKDSEDELARIVSQTISRGGKVIIPAFAVEPPRKWCTRCT